MNNVTITGIICKDIEKRSTNSGVSVANVRVAVRRGFKNSKGEVETDFFNVVCWRGDADFLAQYAHKGDSVGVIGFLQNEEYDDKNGGKRTATNIIANRVEILRRKSDAVKVEHSDFTEEDPGDDLPF